MPDCLDLDYVIVHYKNTRVIQPLLEEHESHVSSLNKRNTRVAHQVHKYFLNLHLDI